VKGLISAIQFITSIPAGKKVIFEPVKMIAFFPVVGLLLGVVVSAFDYLARPLWSNQVVSLLDILLLIALTGALHLDGLGDTADGLYGRRTREKALEIMKDSRVGIMGMVAVVSALAVKWAGISGLEHHRSLFIVLVPAYARGAMIFGMFFLTYGRPGGGTGHPFFKEPLKLNVFIFMLIPVILTCFAGFRGVCLIAGFIMITAIILFFYKKRLGCITGDMLGAMVETNEAGLFLLMSAGG
jgi:adenosylcobinamide-GDP ribazoletransferase